MNILIKPYGSDGCYFRPDTTWERENKDFYSPESVETIEWTPIIFVRISKAGKHIGDKFASRYYDSFNFGALLYCGTGETAFTSCIDHTSLLPSPLYNPIVLENKDNTYEVSRNSETIFSSAGSLPISLKERLEETICTASRLSSLRIGDYVAIELAPKEILASRQDGDISLKATYCENTIIEMNIIF